MPKLLRICRLMVCLVVLALVVAPRSAWADEGVSETAVGSITLDFSVKKGASLDGSTIALYTVAVADYTGPAHFDTSQGQFAESSTVVDISEMNSQELDDNNRKLSKKLEKEAKTGKLTPFRSVTVASNKASFADVPQGLYLVSQTSVAKNGQVIGAFLISVPDREGNLNVTADPKPDAIKISNTTNREAEEEGGSGSKEKSTRRKTSTSGRTSSNTVTQRLARTGDSLVRAWPFALAGFGMLLVGLIMRRRRRRGA